jgi:hypothetical protein
MTKIRRLRKSKKPSVWKRARDAVTGRFIRLREAMRRKRETVVETPKRKKPTRK